MFTIKKIFAQKKNFKKEKIAKTLILDGLSLNVIDRISLLLCYLTEIICQGGALTGNTFEALLAAEHIKHSIRTDSSVNN